MTNSRIANVVLSAVLFFAMVLMYSENAAALPLTGKLLWEQVNPSPEGVADALAEAEKKLEELPKEVKPDSPEEQRRALLKERIALILQWKGFMERIQNLHAAIKALPADLRELKRTLELEKKRAPSKAPVSPSPDGFLEIQSALSATTRAVEEIQTRIRERRDLMSALPERTSQLKEQQKAARKEYEKIIEIVAKESGVLRETLQMQADNARLKGRVADQNLRVLAEEQRFESENVPVQELRLELANLRRQWQEQAVGIYRDTLNQFQENQLREKEADLLQKAQDAEKAVKPDERFTQTWEAEIARLQKNIADYSKLKTDIVTLIAAQEKQLNSERDELKNLKEVVQSAGLSERVAEMLQSAYRRIEIRRMDLTDIVPKEMADKFTTSRTRLYEINDNLSGLRQRWNDELAVAVAGMETTARRGFENRAELLFSSFRENLDREKHVLIEVDAEERRLGLYPLERQEVLVELESFVLSKVFWIQDVAPIQFEILQRMAEEIFSPKQPNSLLNFGLQALSRETVETLIQALQRPLFLSGFLFLTMALPAGFMLLRHLSTYSGQILGSVLLPTYLLILGAMIGAAGFPAYLGSVTQRVLWHVALFVFVGRFIRLLCAPQLATRFGVLEPVTRALYRSLRLALLAYLVCLLPWIIFKDAPFHFEALPRLSILFFEIGVAVAVFLLIRPSSPLIQQLFGAGQKTEEQGAAYHSLLERYWFAISRFFTLFMGVIIALDAFGYRFSAQQLTKRGLLTLLTVFVLIGFYQLILLLLGGFIKNSRRIPASGAPGQRSFTSRSEFYDQVRNTVRFALTVVGVFLLTDYWGLDESIFLALGEVDLYSVSSAGGALEFITLADLTRFLLGMALLIWLVRHLPKLFELLVFSRVKMDSGLRYALVTITRYLFFLLGLFISFSFLKLDLAKVGWLVAAISVGLGFGLQEIVANFVSGIILLVERPIRVGDLVTIGTSLGRVTRINIRSTTILNADLQELMIPNRNLITQEVTNWTLGNNNTRLVIAIGVAYGSDVDQVMALLLELAKAQPETLKDPAPEIFFMNHGVNSLDFELRLYLPDPSMRLTLLSRMNRLINKAFSEQGIEIPFPQQDLHLRSGFFPVESRVEKPS